MREVLGLNPLGGNILCSPSPSEETINRGPNTPIPTTHALICEELKDSGIPPKVVPSIVDSDIDKERIELELEH